MRKLDLAYKKGKICMIDLLLIKLHIAQRIFDITAELHSRSVVHNDLRAPNFLYRVIDNHSESDEEDDSDLLEVEIVLCDFGFSRIERKKFPYPPSVIHDPQIDRNGKAESTPESDIYLEAGLLFEMMYSAFFDERPGDLMRLLLSSDSKKRFLDDVIEKVKKTKTKFVEFYTKVNSLILEMTDKNWEERPRAAEISSKIADLSEFLLSNF
jgi:serine/threonine protein kinase